MRRQNKKLFVIVMLSVLLLSLVLYARVLVTHSEQMTCLCTILTDEDSVYLLDVRLYSVVSPEMLTPGTFSRISTHCPHNKYIHLTVFQDEGWYRGYVANCE